MNLFQLKNVVRTAPRAVVPATAGLYRGGKFLGAYQVANLSSSGALLVDGPALRKRSVYRMRLSLSSDLHLPVDCQVRRRQVDGQGKLFTGVSFLNIGSDMTLFLDSLVSARLDLQAQRSWRALLVDGATSRGRRMQADLQRLGLQVERAEQPLDIIRQLREHGDTIKVVIIHQPAQLTDGGELLNYLQQTYPQIRSFLLTGTVSLKAALAELNAA